MCAQLANGGTGAEAVQHHHGHAQLLAQRDNRRHRVVVQFRHFHQQHLGASAGQCGCHAVQFLAIGNDVECERFAATAGQAPRQRRSHQCHPQRLRRRTRRRHHCQRTQLFKCQLYQRADRMALVDQMLDQPQAAHLGLRIQALPVRGAAGVGDSVTPLPDPQRFDRQTGQPGGDAATIAPCLAVDNFNRVT